MTDQYTKPLYWFLTTLVVSALAVILTTVYVNKPAKVIPVPHTITTEYLTMCSGVEISSPDAYYIAKANCLGRIAGYSAGHLMTIELNNLYIDGQPANKFAHVKPLWCVGPTVTDKQLLESIDIWIANHKADVDVIAKQYDPSNGALIIATKALIDAYPCKE